jgi:glucose/arabinose dehydrogenase
MTARVLLALLLALAAAAPAAAAPRLTPVGNFSQPVHVTAPPADPHRLFVVEKAGTVQVVVDGAARKTFLDIRDEVDSSGNEEGLFSIAFAPDYATSRRFYVYFTAKDPAMGNGSRIKIVEFRRSATDPDAADPAARRPLLEIPHPTNTNHNGGQLQFGPDGMLYAGTGDGGSANDPPNNGQNTHALLGKLLRIDPAPGAGRPYSIPADNPFADGAAGAPEVFAYGLRNPWRFSFDRRTGDLTIADVGQNVREEINFTPRGTGAGANFGWRCYEGTLNTPGVPPCTPPDHVRPVFEYDSVVSGCSVTGGYVVRDPALPSLFGRYVYTDLCMANLRSLVLATSGGTDDREEALSVASVVSFGEDSCGHVYVVSIAGSVSRIDEDPFRPCTERAREDPASPVLRLTRARTQRLLRSKAVYVGARCASACGLTTQAHVRLKVGRSTKRYAFRAVRRAAAAGERVRLKLRLSTAMRRGLAGPVARGVKPLVKVVVTARDAAGNETRRTVFVRVVG